ncbi:hypothetical protein Tco_1105279 [Tanacetum coccineum]
MDTDSTQISIFEIEQSPPPKKNKQVLSHRLTRVFSEDYKHVEGIIFNPRGDRVKQWNIYFLVAALISITIDTLFYYLLEINVEDMCMSHDTSLKVTLTVIRSIVDFFMSFISMFGFELLMMHPHIWKSIQEKKEDEVDP